MTRMQAAALRFIIENTLADGISPSYEEICDGLGLRSRSSAHRLVHALAERGYIRVIPGAARSIEVIRMPGEDQIASIISQQRVQIERMQREITRLKEAGNA